MGDVEFRKLHREAGSAPVAEAPSLRRRAFFLVCLGWVTACLTSLFLSMRAVLRLGGFVASGGPYAIAHPAPEWIWLVPVSIVTGVMTALAGGSAGRPLGRANLLWLAWPALFVSLGWNFFEFGFHPPSGQGIVWGWMVCGMLFIPMGLLPLLSVVPWARNYLQARLREQGRRTDGPDDGLHPLSLAVLVPQFVAVAVGLCGGLFLFHALAG
jgi:hypothetical protein